MNTLRLRALYALLGISLIGATAYSWADSPEVVELRGELTAVMAIGGESTGTAIQLDDGKLAEIDLRTHQLLDKFQHRAEAVVKGSYIVKNGVEIRERKVLVVSEIQLIEPVELEGQLTAVLAFGGETTGMAIKLADGKTVEIDLTSRRLDKKFTDGAQAKVTGTLKDVKGVEIPNRRVLKVTALELK